jgi:hypothetical protein
VAIEHAEHLLAACDALKNLGADIATGRVKGRLRRAKPSLGAAARHFPFFPVFAFP